MRKGLTDDTTRQRRKGLRKHQHLACRLLYRLMKLGETLGYGSLTDRGVQHLIDEGREAWSAFVLSQRPFLIMVATEAAIAQCKGLGLDVPDLSSEVKQLVKLPPLSP